jgi:hypothetical protein
MVKIVSKPCFRIHVGSLHRIVPRHSALHAILPAFLRRSSGSNSCLSAGCPACISSNFPQSLEGNDAFEVMLFESVALSLNKTRIKYIRSYNIWQFFAIIINTSQYIWLQLVYIIYKCFDRLCGLVVNCRQTGPGLDFQRYQIYWVAVDLSRGPLSLMSANESYLKKKVVSPV